MPPRKALLQDLPKKPRASRSGKRAKVKDDTVAGQEEGVEVKIRDIIVRMEHEGADPELIREHMDALNREIEKATDIVEVYQYPLPPHVAAWLSATEAERPHNAPRPEERLRCLVNAQERIILQMIEDGDATDRIDALNALNEMREHESSTRELTVEQATNCNALDLNPSNSGPKTKVPGILSDQACRELMSHPVTMEMAVDTIAALWCYNNRLMDRHVTIMRRDSGACFVAHFWLSLRLLIRLANVSNGTALEAAELYLERVKGSMLLADGEMEAMPFWDDLHKGGKSCPALLDQYEGAAMQQFERILREEMANIGFSFGKMSYNKRYIIAMRKVYITFAEYYAQLPGDHARWLCVSLGLYARLPTWRTGGSDNHFFPAAILPARSWMAALSSISRGNNDSAALILLEFALDRWQLPWTAGSFASSNSRNMKNWYGRVRGSHQIIMRSLQIDGLGGRDGQLTFAINLLVDPRYTLAFQKMDGTLGDELAKLRSNCCAVKRGPHNYPIFKVLSGRYAGELGTAAEMLTDMNAARRELKAAIFKTPNDGDGNEGVQDLLELSTNIKILDHLIPRRWWDEFDFMEWAWGWKDNSARQISTVGCGLGWALFTEELYHSVFRQAMKRVPEGRYLLTIARKLERLAGREPWWDHMRIPEESDLEYPEPEHGGYMGESDQLGEAEDDGDLGTDETAREHARVAVSYAKQDTGKERIGMGGEDQDCRTAEMKKGEQIALPDDALHLQQKRIDKCQYQGDPFGTGATEDGVNEVDFLADHAPGHITFRPQFNRCLPSTIYAGGFFRRFRSDSAEVEMAIATVTECLPDCLEEIAVERQRLRKAIVDLGRFIDIFVWRVAAIINNYFQDETPTLADAIHMASYDGLWDADLLTVDMTTGDVWAHLKTTLAQGYQQEVEGKTDIHLGSLQSSAEDRADILQNMFNFLPVHGYGRTEVESRLKGAHGVRVQANTHLLQGHSNGKRVLYEPPTRHSTRLLDTAHTPDLLAEYVREVGGSPTHFQYKARVRPGQIFVDIPPSPFSTGKFADIVAGSLNRRQENARDQVSRDCKAIWLDEQERDEATLDGLLLWNSGQPAVGAPSSLQMDICDNLGANPAAGAPASPTPSWIEEQEVEESLLLDEEQDTATGADAVTESMEEFGHWHEESQLPGDIRQSSQHSSFREDAGSKPCPASFSKPNKYSLTKVWKLRFGSEQQILATNASDPRKLFKSSGLDVPTAGPSSTQSHGRAPARFSARISERTNKRNLSDVLDKGKVDEKMSVSSSSGRGNAKRPRIQSSDLKIRSK